MEKKKKSPAAKRRQCIDHLSISPELRSPTCRSGELWAEQHTTVPAWSSHCNGSIAVLPPQLAGLGTREEKQACPRVRGVLQTLAYHEQMEFQKKHFKALQDQA